MPNNCTIHRVLYTQQMMFTKMGNVFSCTAISIVVTADYTERYMRPGFFMHRHPLRRKVVFSFN